MNAILVHHVFYLIRHRASGQIMPQMRRGRGYTHWNPSETTECFARLETPRLFPHRMSAQKAIDAWVAMPNSSVRIWEDDEDWRTRCDGRKKSDLEVVTSILEVRHAD